MVSARKSNAHAGNSRLHNSSFNIYILAAVFAICMAYIISTATHAQPTTHKSVLTTEQSLNQRSRAYWHAYSHHRNNVKDILVRAANQHHAHSTSHAMPGLCVLGAGNCNDLDLNVLLQHFDNITLIDIDGAAVQYGVKAQVNQSMTHRIQHLQADITGVADWMTSHRHARELLDQLQLPTDMVNFQRPKSLAKVTTATYDVVVSTTVLSQICNHMSTFMNGHDRQVDAVLAIRNHHIATMYSLLAPDGIGIVITDIVSSQTMPQLQSADADMSRLLNTALTMSNFFTGTNPHGIKQLLHTRFGKYVYAASVAISRPWRWTGGQYGHLKHYLVAAVEFRRTIL